MPASVAFTCIFISCLITVGVLKVFMYFCVSFRVEHISNMFGFFFFSSSQKCLHVDPERRAQCSELLEHPLFTQDSFHIRYHFVLDTLDAGTP